MNILVISDTISIHALRKESDGSCARPAVRRLVFQSTLSVRRATCRPSVSWRFRRISIHALRKESDAQRLVLQHLLAISIHALRKESDLRRRRCDNVKTDFNPRSP